MEIRQLTSPYASVVAQKYSANSFAYVDLDIPEDEVRVDVQFADSFLEDWNNPQTITVTIELGDKLNE